MSPPITDLQGWTSTGADSVDVDLYAHIQLQPRYRMQAEEVKVAALPPPNQGHSNAAQSSINLPETHPPTAHSSFPIISPVIAKLRRDEEAVKIPRPRNSFMIFRCEFCREHYGPGSSKARPDGDGPKTLSKRASEAWRKLTAIQKEVYERLAEEEKREHARQHPTYKYKPARRKHKAAAISSAKRAVGDSPRTVSRDRGRRRQRSLESQQAGVGLEGAVPPAVEYAIRNARRRSSSVPFMGPPRNLLHPTLSAPSSTLMNARHELRRSISNNLPMRPRSAGDTSWLEPYRNSSNPPPVVVHPSAPLSDLPSAMFSIGDRPMPSFEDFRFVAANSGEQQDSQWPYSSDDSELSSPTSSYYGGISPLEQAPTMPSPLSVISASFCAQSPYGYTSYSPPPFTPDSLYDQGPIFAHGLPAVSDTSTSSSSGYAAMNDAWRGVENMNLEAAQDYQPYYASELAQHEQQLALQGYAQGLQDANPLASDFYAPMYGVPEAHGKTGMSPQFNYNEYVNASPSAS